MSRLFIRPSDDSPAKRINQIIGCRGECWREANIDWPPSVWPDRLSVLCNLLTLFLTPLSSSHTNKAFRRQTEFANTSCLIRIRFKKREEWVRPVGLFCSLTIFITPVSILKLITEWDYTIVLLKERRKNIFSANRGQPFTQRCQPLIPFQHHC